MIKILRDTKELVECEGVMGIAMNTLKNELPCREYTVFGTGMLPCTEEDVGTMFANFIVSSIKTMSKETDMNQLKIYQHFLDELQKLNL